MKCFLTVGTTRFDELVETATSPEILKLLKILGYSEFLLQVGSSSSINDGHYHGVDVKVYRYKPTIEPDIYNADLVISHAGAGSCLEVMYARKPCIVVVNDKLMGNHQTELADQLSRLGHVIKTIPSQLITSLRDLPSTEFHPYERGNPKLFSDFLMKKMGMST